MLRAKCMKARSIRAGSNPAGSRGAALMLCLFLGLHTSLFAVNVSYIHTTSKKCAVIVPILRELVKSLKAAYFLL